MMTEKPDLSYSDKIAIELFGGIPAGNLFGMPVLIDPRMPNDRIKIVYRDGREHDLPFP